MGEETVESILKFLNDGTSRIKPSPSRDIILVLGDSGTGKTTLNRFLASSGDDLIAEPAGSSGFTITEPSGVICHSTIESCTVTPELMIDQKGNKTYYDFPGFRDTRSVAHDIGTTYFVRKVIDQAGAIKMIFTVNYNSVREGGNRHDFTKLVENVFTMFKDIGKYEESVCLVVNKVENVYEEVNGQLKIVPDDVMLRDIVKFLEETRYMLRGKSEIDNPPEKVLLYKRTVQLINIFINEKDPKSPRVGIFRRPNKPGPLGKMKEFQAGKAALQKMIYDQLKYTHCNKTDFRYSISEDSKLRLHDIEKNVIESLFQDASTIAEQLVDQYKEQEKISTDIDGLLLELGAGRDKSVYVIRELSKGTMSPPRFVQELISYTNELKFSISMEKLQELSNYSEYLEFIRTVSTSNLRDNWKNCLEEVWNYFDESINWYGFVTDLRGTVSEYSVQHNVDEYSTLLDRFRIDSLEANQEQLVTNMKQFLVKINHDSGRDYEIPLIEEIDKIKLRFFLELLDVGFKPMSAECKEKKLEVQGWNVKMSDVVNVMRQCKNSVVEIFAYNKMFVDCDFSKKGGQLTLVAPEMEVVNKRRITLDGEDAEEHIARKATTTRTVPGSDGASGLPGLPGGPGGELMTVVLTCKNCNSLTVTAIGGSGGTGQIGGDGVPGADGEKAKIFEPTSIQKLMELWQDEGFSPECGLLPQRRRRDLGLFIAFLAFLAASRENLSRKTKCVVRGFSGEPGGNGGAGGIGGDGGNAGRVSILYEHSVPTNERPKVTVAKGPQGAPGEGGHGGKGGYAGDTLHMVLAEHVIFSNTTIERVYYEGSSWMATGGMPGDSNMNEVGFIQPRSINPIDLSYSIYAFKNQLQKMGNSIINSTMKKFVEYFKVHEKSKRSLHAPKFLASTSLFNEVQEPRNSGIALEKTFSKNFHSAVQSLQAPEDTTGNFTAGHSVNYDLMNVQSNLLLMDVLIRKAKGQSVTRTQGMIIDDSREEHAHLLAYNAHVPENLTVYE